LSINTSLSLTSSHSSK